MAKKVKQSIIVADPLEVAIPIEKLEELKDVLPTEYKSAENKFEQVKEVKLLMHTKTVLDGDYLIENLGGGDLHVNSEIIYTGNSIRVSGEIVLYATCFPRVRLTKFGG